MKKNMGIIDRVTRLVIAALFIVLYFTNVITGIWGIIMLVVAGMFVVTSIISFCPLYLPFKISTVGKK
jgi:fatty acid desaturase